MLQQACGFELANDGIDPGARERLLSNPEQR
jgi:hypothetical protein